MVRSESMRLKRFIQIFMMVIIFAIFGTLLGLFFYFMATAPAHPVPSMGLTHSLNNHGYVVYISRTADKVLEILFWGGVGVTIAVMAIEVYWRK